MVTYLLNEAKPYFQIRVLSLIKLLDNNIPNIMIVYNSLVVLNGWMPHNSTGSKLCKSCHSYNMFKQLMKTTRFIKPQKFKTILSICSSQKYLSRSRPIHTTDTAHLLPLSEGSYHGSLNGLKNKTMFCNTFWFEIIIKKLIKKE